MLENLQPITADVLGTILKNANTIPDGVRVESLRIGSVAGSGLVGSIARIHLEYDPPSASGPRSVIVKSPSKILEDNRGLASVEAKFYRHQIPQLSSIRAPDVYYCGLDETTGRSCLLLEDLGDRGFVRQIDGCSKDQAALAIRQISNLHSRWWNHELPPHLNWIRPPGESPVGRFCKRWIQSYPGEWPEALGSLPSRLSERYDDLAPRLASGPRTIVHGDFHSQNISFGTTEEAATFIDFQFVQHATGMVDVARFLVTSLQVDVRRTIEWDLLRDYHSGLKAHGIGDYDFDRCIDDFRAALLWNLTTPLALHVLGRLTQGTRWPGKLPIIERCLTAIEDWDAIDSSLALL